MSQLLARLAIQEWSRSQTLSDNIPNLVKSYVEDICPKGSDALEKDEFWRATKVAAWVSMENEQQSREFSKEYLRGFLNKEAERIPFHFEDGKEHRDAGFEIIQQLISSSLIQQKSLTERLQFSHDLIAEYLGAWYLFDTRECQPELNECVKQRIETMQKDNPHAAESFLNALAQIEVL